MRIVVVGASTAGLKCACRARRLLPDAAITVLDVRHEISLPHGALPAFVAGEWPSLAALRTTNYGRVRDEAFFRDVKRIDVRCGWRVTALDLAGRAVVATSGEDDAAQSVPFDHLVLATGARPRVPAGVVPGAAVHLGHDPLHLRDLRRRLERGEVAHLAVLGAGCVGVSVAAAVAETWGIDVTLVEAEDRVLPAALDGATAAVARRALRDLGIDVRTGFQVETVETRDGRAVVRGAAAAPDVDPSLDADAALVALGVVANADLAREAGLAVGESGGLCVGEDLSCAGGDGVVWACGDCAEVRHRVTGATSLPGRSGLAARMGRVVAERIAGRAVRFGSVVGSFAVRVGDLVIATTGLTTTAAAAAGFDPRVVWGGFPDRAVLDPDRRYDTVALVSDAGTGRLLGLQAIGPGAAVRRADQVAAQLHAGAHVNDLFDLEPCCNPATGDLLDPLAHLAALTVAAEAGGPRALADEVAAALGAGGRAGADVVLLDVREAAELTVEQPPIPGALNIPLGELGGRLEEIPRDRPVVVYCARGPRSFEAVSNLISSGILSIFYLAGGVGLRITR